MRLTSEDLAILDAVQSQEGLMARSEALRHVLRYYVGAKNISVTKSKPKRRSRK